jgi:hypothetical protein
LQSVTPEVDAEVLEQVARGGAAIDQLGREAVEELLQSPLAPSEQPVDVP